MILSSCLFVSLLSKRSPPRLRQTCLARPSGEKRTLVRDGIKHCQPTQLTKLQLADCGVLSGHSLQIHCMLVLSSSRPLAGPLRPCSPTAFWKYWPSCVTIISVYSSSLKAQIFLLCDGMLNFFTARSPRPSRLKIREKNLKSDTTRSKLDKAGEPDLPLFLSFFEFLFF